MAGFPFAILSPDRSWFEGEAETVTAPGQDGEFGVLAHHIPLLAGLKAGVVTVRLPDGHLLYFTVDGGVLGVDKKGGHLLTGRVTPCETLEQADAVLRDLRSELRTPARSAAP